MKVVCPSCAAAINAPESKRGTFAPCPRCGEQVALVESELSAQGRSPVLGSAPRRLVTPPPPSVDDDSDDDDEPAEQFPTFKAASSGIRSGFSALFSTAQTGLLTIIMGLVAWSVLWPDRWEYKIDSPDDRGFTQQMDKLGSEGWELVFARRASDSLDRMGYEMIFKRRR